MKAKKKILKLIFQTLLLVVLLSCSKDNDSTTENPNASIEIVSGNNQTGSVGTQLSDQIVLKITNDSGEPFVGFPLNLITLEVSDGEVFFASASTNNEGNFFINWNLGDNTGLQTLIISVTNNDVELINSPITITATSVV